MEIAFTLKHNELIRRFAPPMPLRERLILLVLPLLAYAIAYVSGIRQAIVLDVAAGIYIILCLLLAVPWALRIHAARVNESEACTVEITEVGFSEKAVGNFVHRHPWIYLGSISDLGDYIMFTSTKEQHVVVIPKSAFDDENHAQAFLVQSRRYWESAKQKQQEEAQRAESSWPPAPRPSNSAEPGNSSEG